jgi:hypothetical protein
MEPTTTLVRTLIFERPLCMQCLVQQTGGRRRAVRAAINEISRKMFLHKEDGRCRSCEQIGPVLYFGRLMAS